MPMYEYECDDCGHRFERIRKFSDEPLTTCPSCGGKVRKLFSSPAIQFKGTGWYITDYARKPSGEQAASSDRSKKAEGGESAKSEKKEKAEKSPKKESGESSSKLASSSSPPKQ